MQAYTELRVSPFYHEVKNQIVQPGHFVACSRYFVERWMPRLGGTAAALVLYLRSLGYYNPLTGECRDGVQVGLKQLAAACGCSERTIQRELEKNEALREFVRVEPCYQQGALGHVQRLENAYRIAMDDPIVPEDAPRLQMLIAQREEGERAASQADAPAHLRPPVRLGPPERLQGQPTNSRIQKGREASAVSVNLSPPSRQFVATLPPDCHQPGVKLTGQVSIPTDKPTERPMIDNNIPAETASKTVVAFLAETGVQINDTLTATLSRDVAVVLSRTPGILEIAQRQARYLPFRRLDKGGTWGGLWRKSIEGDWAPPDAFVEHQGQERARQACQAARTEACQAQQIQQTQDAEIADRLQTAWEAMPAAARTALCQEALSLLPAINRQRYRACLEGQRPLPRLLQDVLDGLCDDLLRKRLALLPRQKETTAPSRFAPPREPFKAEDGAK